MSKLTNINSLKSISENISVLYVEDNAEVRDSTAKFISKFFKHVDVAVDGKDGLDIYKKYLLEKQKCYDLVLSDINMPILNGVEMCKAMKVICPKQKIIIVTAYEDKKYLLDMLEIGIDGFLSKPIDINRAIDVLNKVCLTFQMDNLRYFNILTNSSKIIKIDIQGNIIYVNDRLCELTGYEKKDLIGKPLEILKHPDEKETLFDVVENMSSSHLVNKRRLINKKKDGSKFIADTILLPLFNEHGIITEYMIIKDDVTEVVELKQKLFEKEQEQIIQKRIEKAKESFLLVFTHELKTPLNAIINFSRYIKKKIIDSKVENHEKLTSLSDTVLDNATEMLNTVTQILEISKLTSSNLQYRYETFSLNKLLERLIDKFDLTLESKGIKLIYKEEKEYCIHYDKYRIEQIISNVISNATKYGKDKINIFLEYDDGNLDLCIEDNGEGIKNKKEVFELYSQEDENAFERKDKGTGIGLYFVKLICEDLKIGYTIEDSKNLSGINFKFTFKARKR